MAEFGDWIPPNRYGFGRGRFSLYCVAAVVCDSLSGFGSSESSYALSLDLKGAFNAILPAELFRELHDIRLPGRLINFTSFLTAKRHLFFYSTDPSPRVCGVSVPQGGVLSTISCQPTLKYLGVKLDSRLTWVPRIKYIVDKAIRATNILKVQGPGPGSLGGPIPRCS